jgi:hypothetical protein
VANQAFKQAKDSSGSGDENIFGVAGGIPYIAGGALLGYIYNLVDKALFGDVVPEEDDYLSAAERKEAETVK